MVTTKKKRAAHFLLIPELLYSPPNKAIINAYLDNNYAVDIYAPGLKSILTSYGDLVRTFNVSYSWLWLVRNGFSLRWLSYNCISGTSEDPLAFVGILSFLYRTNSFSLVDEIKSDSYRGDRSEKWKYICKWSIRKSDFRIVNDFHRIDLLRQYAFLKVSDRVMIYPGCFHALPSNNIHSRSDIRKSWGISDDSFVIGSSGGFNMTAGADWLLNSLRDYPDLYAVIQPLGISPLADFLLKSLSYSERIYVENRRLDWNEAWTSAQGLDAGICIYTNPASQFQKMGISSNRLCMFIAMGIPVIASRQESFKFLEQFDCGILVSNYSEFKEAIINIRRKNILMKNNCRTCFDKYIRVTESYQALCNEIKCLK